MSLKTSRWVLRFALLVAVIVISGAVSTADRDADSAVRDALLRALPRYRAIPVDRERDIVRVEPYLDDEMIVHLDDGSTYRVIVQLRSR